MANLRGSDADHTSEMLPGSDDPELCTPQDPVSLTACEAPAELSALDGGQVVSHTGQNTPGGSQPTFEAPIFTPLPQLNHDMQFGPENVLNDVGSPKYTLPNGGTGGYGSLKPGMRYDLRQSYSIGRNRWFIKIYHEGRTEEVNIYEILYLTHRSGTFKRFLPGNYSCYSILIPADQIDGRLEDLRFAPPHPELQGPWPHATPSFDFGPRLGRLAIPDNPFLIAEAKRAAQAAASSSEAAGLSYVRYPSGANVGRETPLDQRHSQGAFGRRGSHLQSHHQGSPPVPSARIRRTGGLSRTRKRQRSPTFDQTGVNSLLAAESLMQQPSQRARVSRLARPAANTTRQYEAAPFEPHVASSSRTTASGIPNDGEAECMFPPSNTFDFMDPSFLDLQTDQQLPLEAPITQIPRAMWNTNSVAQRFQPDLSMDNSSFFDTEVLGTEGITGPQAEHGYMDPYHGLMIAPPFDHSNNPPSLYPHQNFYAETTAQHVAPQAHNLAGLYQVPQPSFAPPQTAVIPTGSYASPQDTFDPTQQLDVSNNSYTTTHGTFPSVYQSIDPFSSQSTIQVPPTSTQQYDNPVGSSATVNRDSPPAQQSINQFSSQATIHTPLGSTQQLTGPPALYAAPNASGDLTHQPADVSFDPDNYPIEPLFQLPEDQGRSADLDDFDQHFLQ